MGKPKTMKVKFVDGPLRRDLPEAGITCERDETIEVDAELGDRLIQQPGWVKSKAKVGKKSGGAKKSGSKGPTIADLKKQLKAKGIDFPAKAKKPELEELLATGSPTAVGEPPDASSQTSVESTTTEPASE